MKFILWIPLVALVGFTNTINAEPLFVQMGYGSMKHNLKAGSIAINSDVDQVTAAASYQIHPNIAVEGMIGLGLSNKEALKTNTNTYSNRVNNMFGIYVKPTWSITDTLSVNARLGYSQAAMEITDRTSTNERKLAYTSSGLSYGVGLSYAFKENMHINLDYLVFGGNLTGLNDADGSADFSGLNIAVDYKY
jgi:opacity protein-like surface antigen